VILLYFILLFSRGPCVLRLNRGVCSVGCKYTYIYIYMYIYIYVYIYICIYTYMYIFFLFFQGPLCFAAQSRGVCGFGCQITLKKLPKCATHCNTLQRYANAYFFEFIHFFLEVPLPPKITEFVVLDAKSPSKKCNILQHTAIPCNDMFMYILIFFGFFFPGRFVFCGSIAGCVVLNEESPLIHCICNALQYTATIY